MNVHFMPMNKRDESANEPMPGLASGVSTPAPRQADVIRSAHRVLIGCHPRTSLPIDLAKVRAMLDSHMFGRDNRELRDDAVRVAWQIDSLRPSQAR